MRFGAYRAFRAGDLDQAQRLWSGQRHWTPGPLARRPVPTAWQVNDGGGVVLGRGVVSRSRQAIWSVLRRASSDSSRFVREGAPFTRENQPTSCSHLQGRCSLPTRSPSATSRSTENFPRRRSEVVNLLWLHARNGGYEPGFGDSTHGSGRGLEGKMAFLVSALVRPPPSPGALPDRQPGCQQPGTSAGNAGRRRCLLLPGRLGFRTVKYKHPGSRGVVPVTP